MKSKFQLSNIPSQILSLQCRLCGARFGELCSDTSVFVRADATSTTPPPGSVPKAGA